MTLYCAYNGVEGKDKDSIYEVYRKDMGAYTS
jgi:hypothetical protein